MKCDTLVIGAGVFGLSIARAIRRLGREVVVVDAAGPGAGASATPLGVLAPHSPDRWNEKKQAQFEALTSLADVVVGLEAETSIDIGYRRCGRLIPLIREHHVALWQARAVDAASNWRGVAALSVVTPSEDWLPRDAAPFGAALCGLSARIDARAYVAALARSVERIEAGYRLAALEDGAAVFDNGERIRARHIVLANGAGAFEHLPDLDDETPAGRGEKGQAAILRLAPGQAVSDLPLIYRDRLYIVPRGETHVAVGATSEREYGDPDMTDTQLDSLIDKAEAICPALEGAEVIERWARLRPRAADKRLLVGPHPTHAGVTVATGGFKTGLAMAHKVAETVARLPITSGS